MESHPSVTDRPTRVSPVVWILGAGLVVALVAIFIFNISISTVAYYGFLAFMFGGHFFMHGSHGTHGNHAGRDQSGAESNKDEHARHTGGCH